jgi:hypothetical protein
LDVHKIFNQWKLEYVDKKQNYDELRYNVIGLMDGRADNFSDKKTRIIFNRASVPV